MDKKSQTIIAIAFFFLLVASANAEENYKIVNIKTDKSLNIEVKSFSQGNIELELTVDNTQIGKLIPIQIYDEYTVLDENKKAHSAIKHTYYNNKSFETTQSKETIKVAYEMRKLIKFGHNTTIIMLVPADYNTGIGFDFNWTKVTGDANVMPTGSDRVYVEQDQAFYDQNLVGYWKFDNTNIAGDGILDDTNNDNDGTFEGGANINALGMWDTNAGFFDGSGDRINVGDGTSLDLVTDFSISMWYKSDDIDSDDGLIAQNIGGQMAWSVHIESGTVRFAVWQDNTFPGEGVTSYVPTEGVWQHVAATYDGTNTRLYKNGVLEDTGVFTGTVQTPTTTYIGNYHSAPFVFEGLIDEVKIYNKVLTLDEIQQDYNAWMTGTYTSPVQDAGEAADWDTITWQEATDVNNSLTVDYRGCSTSDCGTAGDWLTGLSGGGITHSNIHADGNRYFQFRVNFDTNSASWNTVRSSNADKGNFAKFSNMTIEYTTAAEGVCDCPSSGNWEINDGSECTLSDLCNAPADVHISSGSLNITASGELVLASGNKIIIQKGEFLYTEKGGKIVIEK